MATSCQSHGRGNPDRTDAPRPRPRVAPSIRGPPPRLPRPGASGAVSVSALTSGPPQTATPSRPFDAANRPTTSGRERPPPPRPGAAAPTSSCTSLPRPAWHSGQERAQTATAAATRPRAIANGRERRAVATSPGPPPRPPGSTAPSAARGPRPPFLGTRPAATAARAGGSGGGEQHGEGRGRG